jgi:hypothetical protein
LYPEGEEAKRELRYRSVWQQEEVGRVDSGHDPQRHLLHAPHRTAHLRRLLALSSSSFLVRVHLHPAHRPPPALLPRPPEGSPQTPPPWQRACVQGLWPVASPQPRATGRACSNGPARLPPRSSGACDVGETLRGQQAGRHRSRAHVSLSE